MPAGIVYQAHRPVVAGTRLVATADHPLAAAVGAEFLADGAHAAEAALAMNLVLCATRPHMCGPGGDLFALIYEAKSGRVHALNGSGRAPARASLAAYRARGLAAVPAAGILSATVPGAPAAWFDLLERFGRRSFAELAAPAVAYARQGCVVYPELSEAIAEAAPLMAAQPAAAGVYLPGGEPPRPGTLLCQPGLAATLEELAREGCAAFYRGGLARALVAHSELLDGCFAAADLAAHHSDWVEPLRGRFAGLDLLTLPPNSQGLALLLMAQILDGLDLAGLARDPAALIHALVEAKKLAFADRDRYVADPAFAPAPLAGLLSPAYAARRRGLLDPARAAGQPPAGSPPGGEDTVYLSAVDRAGNAVALIQSIYQSFGSVTLVPGTGIMLHNRARGFSLEPGHPGCLAPGKRPYHTLHCALGLGPEGLRLCLGSPGADGQPQTLMQLLVHHLVLGADPQQAVEAPRFRSDPDGQLNLEDRFGPRVLAGLAGRGHRLAPAGAWAGLMGSAQLVVRDPAGGVLLAGADPRRQAYAIAR